MTMHEHDILAVLAFACLLVVYILKNYPKGNEAAKEKAARYALLLAFSLLLGYNIYIFFII